MRKLTTLLLLVALLYSCGCWLDAAGPVHVAAAATSASGAASLTERDFRRMKMKELRAFLELRGLTCPGCQEKSDFVRVAYEHRDTKPLASGDGRELPDSEFWTAWASNARAVCEQAVQRRVGGAGEDAPAAMTRVCEVVEQAVESFMMQHGKQVASRLKKSTHHMLKTSYRNVYHDAGTRLLRQLVNHCLASSAEQAKCASLGHVHSLMQDSATIGDFKAWVTNVGIENTNPMYEILERHSDL